MNVIYLLVPAVLLYALAHRFYAPFLARVFGEDDRRLTPARTHEDGIDFVPTRPHVLFAHHFSAIAAAGPILGPTMALLYGYAPAFLWIVIGGIGIGAVHDFACLFVSMREGGRSIAQIARKLMGNTPFLLFALFIVFNLVVVNAVFINITAVSLTSLRSIHELDLPPDQTLFRTVSGLNSEPQAAVGGIASSSAIALTIIAPLLGYVVVKRRLRESIAYPIATLLCVGSVWIGFAYPISLSVLDLGFVKLEPMQLWIVLISLYVLFAASVPVWLILQPREFVSVQFLYLGIGVLVAALIGVGIRGVPIQAPAEAAQGEAVLGHIWPVLFVTIACGAVSGFHGLVASGTTSKQLALESHAKHIGYLAMLGESGLALCVTLAIAAGVSYAEYTSFLIAPAGVSAATWKANPVLAFSVGVAGVCEAGLGIPKWLGIIFGLLMVEGFVLDTLDVSIRLNRYLFEEIWSLFFRKTPRLLRNYWVNSAISVGLMLVLATGDRAEHLWPIFGTGNQLLASLSLITVSLWLFKNRRKTIFVLVPAALVGTTTLGSLIYLFCDRYWPLRNYPLMITDLVFLSLAVGFGIFALRAYLRLRAERRRREVPTRA